jgi:drug/metabolite transporter (DMT)-like permease
MTDSANIEEQVPAARVLDPAVTFGACLAAALIPGLGHALLKKWDRALVFVSTISLMFGLGLTLKGSLFNPDFSDFFAILKFVAEAGNGLIYWVCWIRGMGVGEPTAYTYDFGNLFLFAAGLLNMLVVVDVFDIAMGRKP